MAAHKFSLGLDDGTPRMVQTDVDAWIAGSRRVCPGALSCTGGDRAFLRTRADEWVERSQ